MGNPTGQGLLADIEITTSKLQNVVASINGILDRSMLSETCIEIIKKHIARTNEMFNDLRQEAADWRNAKYIAEQKETAVHLALNDMRAERDAFRLLPAEIAGLLARFDEIVAERDAFKSQLSQFLYAVQHVTEDGNTTSSYSTSAGWAMVHADRLIDLEVAEEQRNKLLKVREAADALAEDVEGHIAWTKELSPEHDVYILERQVKAYKEARDG